MTFLIGIIAFVTRLSLKSIVETTIFTSSLLNPVDYV